MMPHPLRRTSTGLLAAGSLVAGSLAAGSLALAPVAAHAVPADPTPQQYGVRGIITDHAGGMPVAGATRQATIVSVAVSATYDGTTSLLINLAGKLPRKTKMTVGWGLGTMVEGACQVAASTTDEVQVYYETAKSFEPVKTWDEYDPTWNCGTAWTLDSSGVEQDRVFGTVYPQTAIPEVEPWYGAKLIVAAGRWVRIPTRYWLPSPAMPRNVTITVRGKGVQSRTVTVGEIKRDEKWLFPELKVRGTKPRSVTVTVTPEGGNTKSTRIKVVPKRLKSKLKPGLYHAKKGAKALRFRVTRSGRVKGLRMTLSIYDGGSMSPTYDRFKFPGFQIPRSGYVLNDSRAKGAQRVSVLRVLDRRAASVTGFWDVPYGPGTRTLRALWVKK